MPDRAYEVVIAGRRYRASKAQDGHVGSVSRYEQDGSLTPLWDSFARKPVDGVIRSVLAADPNPGAWSPPTRR